LSDFIIGVSLGFVSHKLFILSPITSDFFSHR